MLRLRLRQTAICSGLRYWPTMRILPIWEPSRAITFTGARSVPPRSAPKKRATKLIGWLAKHGITGCSVTRGRLSRLQPWETLVGVHNNTFDERICYVYWCDFIKGAVADCRPLLDYLRRLPSGGFSYGDLVRLEKRWTSAKRFWQRW